MKDISHHINKINRKALKHPSAEVDNYNWEQNYRLKASGQEQKKLRKEAVRQSDINKVHVHEDQDERNKDEKHRTPIIRRRSHH